MRVKQLRVCCIGNNSDRKLIGRSYRCTVHTHTHTHAQIANCCRGFSLRVGSGRPLPNCGATRERMCERMVDERRASARHMCCTFRVRVQAQAADFCPRPISWPVESVRLLLWRQKTGERIASRPSAGHSRTPAREGRPFRAAATARRNERAMCSSACVVAVAVCHSHLPLGPTTTKPPPPTARVGRADVSCPARGPYACSQHLLGLRRLRSLVLRRGDSVWQKLTNS